MCALCLGLAGSPKLLGRAFEVPISVWGGGRGTGWDFDKNKIS